MAVWRNSGRGGGIANIGGPAGDRNHVPAQVSRLNNVCFECNNNYYIMGVTLYEWL